MMRSYLIKRLLFVLFGTAIGLFISEIVIRLAGIAPEVAAIRHGRFQLSTNPKLGYEPVPNLSFQGKKLGFYQYRGLSNRLGYRDIDHTLEKPPGIYRIAVLGDSIGAGLKIEDYRDTFPAILQELFSSAGLNMEVLNFSVSGYNTRQEVETLKAKALAFEPDLVLLAYCMNDIRRCDSNILELLHKKEEKQSGVSAKRSRFFLWSALYRYVRFSWIGMNPEQITRKNAQDLEMITENTVAESFEELAQTAQTADLEVLVVVFPTFKDILSDYPCTQHHRKIRELSLSLGFHYLDLLPAFQEGRRKAGEDLWIDVFHPTAAGHRCAAETMCAYIFNKIYEAPKK